MTFAPEISRRLDELAAISATSGEITRLAFTPEMKAALAVVAGWMDEAGMRTELDGAGNVFGRYESHPPGGRALLLGSHLDTVVNAGRYDGILGVVTAIACVAELQRRGRRLPVAIEVVGFGDEEGVRFGTTIAGNHAVAGRFSPAKLALKDRDGVTAHDAITSHGLDAEGIAAAFRQHDPYLAYVELHIEQGPVLESQGRPLGCVTSIVGASTFEVRIHGRAGHAGTVPMDLRQDALAAAADCILAVEKTCHAGTGVVGTVGSLTVSPGAHNVIPGEVRFSVDVRSGEDEHLSATTRDIATAFEHISHRRRVDVAMEPLSHRPATACSPWIMERIAAAIRCVGERPVALPSGAGHDAAAMSDITDVGMLFVRCRDGVSHTPEEHVTDADIEIAAQALLAFIESFEDGLSNR